MTMIDDALAGQRAELARVSWHFNTPAWRRSIGSTLDFGARTLAGEDDEGAEVLVGLRAEMLALADDASRAEVDGIMLRALAAYDAAIANRAGE